MLSIIIILGLWCFVGAMLYSNTDVSYLNENKKLLFFAIVGPLAWLVKGLDDLSSWFTK